MKFVIALVLAGCAAAAQTASGQTTEIGATPAPASESAVAAGVTPPGDYVIGPDDQLSVLFWRDKDLSGDVTVRPDGMISLPLLNEVQAAGLTPGQLREKITELATKFIDDPSATVVIRQINSRKVFVNGQVEKPGQYSLSGPMTVLQVLSTAGGLREYAKRNKIVVIRNDKGRQVSFGFNYDEVMAQKKLDQNILLRPGDTVLVP
jgi:polysaccharide export outer membrane protein